MSWSWVVIPSGETGEAGSADRDGRPAENHGAAQQRYCVARKLPLAVSNMQQHRPGGGSHGSSVTWESRGGYLGRFVLYLLVVTRRFCYPDGFFSYFWKVGLWG